jgi:perosamine synthetase
LIDWNLEEAAPFTYIIRIVNGQRDKLMDFLKSRDIGSGVHYIANHIQPFFKKYASPLPITEKVWQEILTLPLYYDMTDKDASKVVTAVKDFFKG